MRVAQRVELDGAEREALEQRERARIVLPAADGLQDRQIAAELGSTKEKAGRWRKRYLAGGLAALEQDAPRPGRRRTVPEGTVREVVRRTTQEKPEHATQWSTRRLARATGLSAAASAASGAPTGSSRTWWKPSSSATIRASQRNWKRSSACI